jgi:hypothetical protein
MLPTTIGYCLLLQKILQCAIALGIGYMVCKIGIVGLIALAVSFVGYSQNYVSVTKEDSVAVNDKIQAMRSKVKMTSSEERMLREIYFELVSEGKKEIRCSFLTLNNLARAVAYIYDKDAFECLNSMMVYLENNRSRIERSFNTVLTKVSPSVAFQFINIETSNDNRISQWEAVSLANDHILRPARERLSIIRKSASTAAVRSGIGRYGSFAIIPDRKTLIPA